MSTSRPGPGGSPPEGAGLAPLYGLIRDHRRPEDRRIVTAAGQGYLWQVFAERIGVVLGSDPDRVTFLTPSEVTGDDGRAHFIPQKESAR